MRKTILITGASSGLGRGMAREFARSGHNLALCARRMDRLLELQRELLVSHPSICVSVRELDVLDHESVFRVFTEFRNEFGMVDRIIVNAGMGKGKSLGTGHFGDNRRTAETNFVAALAQCEAAMEIFRAQDAGHLVVISSMSAMRGMPRSLTTYAATKAGIAALAEGIRADVMGKKRIKVSTIFPGYIRTELNEKVKNAPFIIDEEAGCRMLVKAISREPVKAYVPRWPWQPLGFVMRNFPLKFVARMG